MKYQHSPSSLNARPCSVHTHHSFAFVHVFVCRLALLAREKHRRQSEEVDDGLHGEEHDDLVLGRQEPHEEVDHEEHREGEVDLQEKWQRKGSETPSVANVAVSPLGTRLQGDGVLPVDAVLHVGEMIGVCKDVRQVRRRSCTLYPSAQSQGC